MNDGQGAVGLRMVMFSVLMTIAIHLSRPFSIAVNDPLPVPF